MTGAMARGGGQVRWAAPGGLHHFLKDRQKPLAIGGIGREFGLGQRPIQELVVPGQRSYLGRVEITKPHRPVGKLSCRYGCLQEREDSGMSLILVDFGVEVQHRLFLALERLHKISIFIEQESRDA